MRGDSQGETHVGGRNMEDGQPYRSLESVLELSAAACRVRTYMVHHNTHFD
jgi:hypothetical protein